MKRIKQGMIDPKKMISKAEYAKKIGVTPPAITKQINKGYITIVSYSGGEAIYCE